MRKKTHTNWEQTLRYLHHKKRKNTYRSKQEKKDKDSLIIECKKCNEIITLDSAIDKPFTLTCPQCGHIIESKKKGTLTLPVLSFNTIKQYILDNFIESILIIIGLLFLMQPTLENIKISFTLILIATFLLFLITGEESTKKIEKKPSKNMSYHNQPKDSRKFLEKIQELNERIRLIPLSNRIGIVLILWTLLLYVITADVEIFFILIFIGIIITRELTDLYTSVRYKKTLNVYIIIFLFTYGILISQKIIEILSN